MVRVPASATVPDPYKEGLLRAEREPATVVIPVGLRDLKERGVPRDLKAHLRGVRRERELSEHGPTWVGD
jgi:hypothetical protein